ncbi:MAG: family 4 glycosyl hydrolase [Anaerolineae bacterium]
MPSKITIIGGGSSTFVPQLMRLFLSSEVLAGSTISLMDIDSHRLEIMHTLCRELVKAEKADLKIESTTNQKESLTDADFVITAISVGGMDAWEKDIEIPAKYGVYMPIADSIGPGGMMRAFRHIPVLTSVCEDLEEVSPEAVVFNYSNPATANTMAMRWVSSIDSFGLCTCSSIPRNAEYLAFGLGVKGEELVMPAPAGGLNHCAAVLELKLTDGRDALPLFAERAEQWIMKWGLETFGVLPYCWSHWSEFFPSLLHLEDKYEGKLQGLAMSYGLHVHDMDHERERSNRLEPLVDRLVKGEEAISLDVLPTAEAIEVVEIIEAMLENRNEIHVVNAPNEGAISNLPDDAIVEVSSVVGGYGIMPMHVGPLPEAWAAMLRTHITVQELTVEAAITGDHDVALQAFLLDPQISAKLNPEETEKLLDELLAAHANYLPQFAC